MGFIDVSKRVFAKTKLEPSRYLSPENSKEMRNISMLTMGCGNVKVLKQTLESFKDVCDEFIYGDLLLFPEDREILRQYEKEYNLHVYEFPFYFIFKFGFSAILNALAGYAKNDLT